MLRSEYCSRFVGSNGQDAEIEGSELLTNFFENFAVACITRVKQLFILWSLDDESSPQSGIQVVESSLRPMAYWHKSDLVFSFVWGLDSYWLHPVQ